MPRKTRRQLVGRQEDIERREREDALQALEQELHHMQLQEFDIQLPAFSEPGAMMVPLFKAKIKPLTVHL